MKITAKQIAEALGILKGAGPEAIASVVADDKLSKAASGLGDAPDVKDHWAEGNLNAPAKKDQIKTGPSEEASGGGAEKMIGHYSEPAEQHGTTLTAESLSRIMAPMAAASKAQSAVLLEVVEVLKGLRDGQATLLKGKVVKAKDDDEDEEDESEVVEINEKAKSAITALKAALKKAKKAANQMKWATGKDKMSCKADYDEHMASALAIVRKAAPHVLLSGDEALRTEFLEIASKADIDVTQEEEEEDEDDAEKAKKAKELAEAAAKATSTADPAAKGTEVAVTPELRAILEETQAQVKKALEGTGMLTTDVKGLMDKINSLSKHGGMPPAMVAKSEAAAVSTFDQRLERISALEDIGQLTEAQAFTARDIVSKARAAERGELGNNVHLDLIAKATPAVQAIFADLKSAAA